MPWPRSSSRIQPGDVVEEVAIVGHRDDRARVGRQVVLQPGHRLGVEVVGRLVEQQQVRRAQQQPAQRHAAPLAARQSGHLRVGRRQAQRVHRLFELAVELPGVGLVDAVLHLALLLEDLLHLVGRQVLAQLQVELVVAVQQVANRLHALFDVALDRLGRVELRLLVQEADLDAGRGKRLAREVRVLARHDLQQRALARAVHAEHADLGARIERQPDVAKDLRVGLVNLAQPLHGVDELHKELMIADCRLQIENYADSGDGSAASVRL